jgi:hypothetical protein
LLCSVMVAVSVPSKKCFMILVTPVCCEGCITEYKQAVQHTPLCVCVCVCVCVCARARACRAVFRTDQLVKILIVFCQISWMVMVI